MTGRGSRGRRAHATRMRMNCIDQYLHMVRRRVLADAMAEVEDVGRPRTSANVGRPEIVEHAASLRLDGGWRREEHGGVEIALQAMARADEGASRTEVHRPVDAQHVAFE